MGTEPESITPNEPDEPAKNDQNSAAIGVGIALGVSIGTALSLALDSWAFVGLGIALGVVFGVAFQNGGFHNGSFQKTGWGDAAAPDTEADPPARDTEAEPPAPDTDRPSNPPG
ncbi:hypothetical protein IWX78_000677 [Mycetocola sp. CAN_C7]|uniref:hypothetical protein n=1 Tax=Mycetocola sp. CAN_C7 TaxID=2787724 RepID=UPI0018CB9858